ncbi:hypothetical protein P4V39_02680 [Brevibacillus borstelensis]|uniref:hypothetical protein n=1 Tax=Brevibacillus borstelensis TaxID=45462 RepID=UPI002E251E36|nr:hypothetical protein [Brevibacillus borstelensis]
MNLVDAVVTKVLREPRYNDQYTDVGVVWWEVTVEYDCYGRTGERTLTFKTKEEAEKVTPGYEFQT